MKPFIALISLLISANVFSQDKNFSIDTVQVKSTILNENRNIIVYKPINISISDSVKFIYLIDGEYSNYRFQKIKERFKDSISNLIAIGIVNTDRRRDLLYAQGADKFLDFIALELIPVIEKGYKTKMRTLFGHSFGGGFTIYAMINKPDYFGYYIASSPTPIMDLVKKNRYQHIDSVCKNKIVLTFSYGSKDLGQVRKWAQILKDNLSELQFEDLIWHFRIFEGKDHNNSDISALLSGLNDLK